MLGDEIPEWARSCPLGKQKFATAEDARRAWKASTQGKAHPTFKGTVHTYKCKRCTGFHWTTKTHDQRKRKYGQGRDRK